MAKFAAKIVPDFKKFMTNLEDKLKLDFWQDLRPILAEFAAEIMADFKKKLYIIGVSTYPLVP